MREYLPTTSERAARSNSRARRRRRSERGAVFVEALIVCLLLTLFMAGGLFLHRIYARKIVAMHEARGLTWGSALRGCRPSIDIRNTFNLFVKIGNPMSIAPVQPPDYFGLVGHASESADGGRVVTSRPLGAGDYHVSASMQLACNETIQGERGDLLDIVGYAAQNLIPTFH